MAAKHFYRQGFLLLLFNFISTAALEKRFSDFKRCADEECSMLLCRGKAVEDFSGPDCRFLSFKKSEHVYVYYKLSGRRADIWAGSVGSHFGYFPKDLLAVNHIYTEKELEIRAEETDFVCFENGFDKFDNYDIDSLLGSSPEESESKGTSEENQVADDTPEETQPLADTASLEHTEHHENAEHLDKEEDLSASSPELESDVAAELSPAKEVETETAATAAAQETPAEDTDVVEEHTGESYLEHGSETKDALENFEVVEPVAEVDPVPEKEPVSISEGVQIPDLKTTYGTTFDAVTTDEDITKNVTPYVEEEGEYVGIPPEDDVDVKTDTPLLSFSEENVNTPASEAHEGPTETEEPEKVEKNMWTSFGDAVFSVVTGGERTAPDVSSEEDDDDEEQEEEAAPETPLSFDKAKIKKPVYLDPPKELEIIEPDPQEYPPTPVHDKDMDDKETNGISDKLVFVDNDDEDGEVIGPGDPVEETLEPTKAGDLVSQHDPAAVPEVQKSNLLMADEATEHKEEEEELPKDPDIGDDTRVDNSSFANEQIEDPDIKTPGDKMVATQDSDSIETETEMQQEPFTEDIQSDSPEIKDDDDDRAVDDSEPSQMHGHVIRDLESNTSQAELYVEEPEVHEKRFAEEMEDEEPGEVVEEEKEEKEELLEDENALSYSQSNDTDSAADDTTLSPPEPEYSDSVLRLTLLRDHFSEENMGRIQKLLGLKNLFRVEAMFEDLDTEMRATRASHVGTTQDIENALESILEASENAILDEIEKMLDSQGMKRSYDPQMDTSALDEETEILDEFQELSFSLRQKYSTASDSTPLAADKLPDTVPDEPAINVEDHMPHIVEEAVVGSVPEVKTEDNLTGTEWRGEQPAETRREEIVVPEVPSAPDISVEEDGGHFNKNKDNQLNFGEEEMQKVPQDTLENPFDMGVGVEVEHSSSGSLDSMDPVPEIPEEEVGLFSTGIVYAGCIFSMIWTNMAEWTVVIVSLLPDEWKPGETFFGCPWQAVIVTALVGVVTFTLFFWRTVLAVKKKEYLVDEKRLTEQIQALKQERTDALTKISELQKQTEQLKENQKQSRESVSSKMKKIQDLERKVREAETYNDSIAEEKSKYAKLLEEERAKSLQNETRIEKLEKSNEKLQGGRKKVQEALTKTTVLLDEAKLREDARNVQHKCLEKEYTALKEENKTLKVTIKSWEGKHTELNEQIKVYQKSQKELEDSVVLKDHNVEVLSELLADLDACDSQKGDTKALANGEVAPDKKTAIKNRIKQMMDVTRVQTTLSVVEEERDRFMTKLLNEEKSRKSLEEQHQELEHAIATLKSEKSHVENQLKILQQKNEIMVEMYQQKENALQQRLTKEELERRSKENMLTEVGGKAVEAEEQVKILRQRINEMEEQMKKTEEVYKEQIKEQENKTHSNWVNARNAERALNQEKLEASKLREKLAVLTSQLNERRAPLFRPNSGQPAGPRQGDSYGPSPVSGGAPSPPLMIEGPRRPPSAPVGRRIDPYGPRPPSDPHGRYPDNKHIPGMDMMGPRSSSPANLDGSTQAVDPPQIKVEAEAEASTDPEPGPGSFLVSPIRDSPGPMVSGPPPGPGPHDPHLPPGPHGRMPPPGPYRPPPRPGPGPYHFPPDPHAPLPPPPHGPPLPANGHPGMPLPGPMGGEFGPRPTNGHALHLRQGPVDPRGPPPPRFRPPPPHHFGPMPPPHGIRGPMGPRAPIPPDMRYPGPPMNLPPGVPPHPAHGDAYGPAPPDALHGPAGVPSGPHGPAGAPSGPRQEAPQDSARPATAKP